MQQALAQTENLPTVTAARGLADVRDYQQRMVAIGIDDPFHAFWLFLGAGKTLIALMIADALYHDLSINRVLIISTVRNVEDTWPNEPCEWSHLEHINITPVRGSLKQRLSALNNGNHYHAINVENVKWLTSLYPVKKSPKSGVLNCAWPFDMVIMDESGLFRNPASQRFKALRRMRPWIHRMVQLSASPAPKGLINLWSQIYLLDGGKRLGHNITAYRNRYFERQYSGFGYMPRPGSQGLIINAIGSLATTLLPEDYQSLPEVLTRPVYCDLPSAAFDQYKTMEHESILTIAGEDLIAVSAAVLYGKLIQLANGAYYTDDKGTWNSFHNAKLDALAQIVDECDQRPLIVAYIYRSDKARLKERFPSMVFLGDSKRGDRLIERWNNDEIPLLGVQPQSGGHGLNLQKGHAHGIVWFSLTPDLELFEQLNGRLNRTGQRHITSNYLLIARRTVDELVWASLKDKDATQLSIKAAFVDYIEGLQTTQP